MAQRSSKCSLMHPPHPAWVPTRTYSDRPSSTPTTPLWVPLRRSDTNPTTSWDVSHDTRARIICNWLQPSQRHSKSMCLSTPSREVLCVCRGERHLDSLTLTFARHLGLVVHLTSVNHLRLIHRWSSNHLNDCPPTLHRQSPSGY